MGSVNTWRRDADGCASQPDGALDMIRAGRVMARAFGDSVDEAQRVAVARTFGACLTAAWWRRMTERQGLSAAMRPPLEALDRVPLPPAAAALSESLGQTAATLDTETAAYQIGLTYTAMLPRVLRSELGVYYTPPSLTDRLIGQAGAAGVDWTRCRVLDPACGGGAFLAPIARKMMEALPGCDPRLLVENLSNRLRGYEIDPFAAWLSQVMLDAVVLPVTVAAGRGLPVLVEICDSLRQEPPRERFDLVIGNPPYGRVRLDAEDRARYRRSLFGHANLYGLFTDLALRHVAGDGVIAYVTPTSFLAGEYFKALRALLGAEARPVALDFVSVRRGVFDDVLQETLLATYRCGNRAPVRVHEITPEEDSVVRIEEAGSYALPEDAARPWILPRSAAQAPLIAVLGGMTGRLADWGYAVSTGPLVWNRFKDQLVRRGGVGRVPLIWAEAVTPDGQFVWRAERRGHTAWFELREGDGWLSVDKPCVLLQRTTAKEQSRRLIAAALPAEFLDEHGAVVVENHLNMLRPRVEAPAVPAEVLAAFLNSAAADRAFRCINGSVAVSAYELEAMPLPPPAELGPLTGLVARGARRHEIEAECARLFRDGG